MATRLATRIVDSKENQKPENKSQISKPATRIPFQNISNTARTQNATMASKENMLPNRLNTIQSNITKPTVSTIQRTEKPSLGVTTKQVPSNVNRPTLTTTTATIKQTSSFSSSSISVRESQSLASLRGGSLKRPLAVAGITKQSQIMTRAKSPRIEKEKIEDVDLEDHDDPLQVSEYVNDIYEYLREIEV